MKKLLKIVCVEWRDVITHDKRDLMAAQKAGFDVAVMAKGARGDKMRETCLNGVRVYLCDTRPIPWLPVSFNRVVASIQWVINARRYGADVLNCVEIFSLTIGWLATLFVRKDRKPRLVYDSHEFEMGRNTIVPPIK